MTAGYEIQHNPTVSSGTVAKGPGIVNHLAHEDWKFSAWKTIHKMNTLARIDLFKMYWNVHDMYISYAHAAMICKKANHPKVIKSKQKYEEAKESFEKFVTIAILSGHVQL